MSKLVNWAILIGLIGLLIADTRAEPATPAEPGSPDNLVRNSYFETRIGNGPADFKLTGTATYRYLAQRNRDISSWGVAFLADQADATASVSQMVHGLTADKGKWFRFSVRGLADSALTVGPQDLVMQVEFFGRDGAVQYDAKAKSLQPQIERDRENMTVNGDFHRNGSAVWRTYQLDFMKPFPQVDSVRLSVIFSHLHQGSQRAAFLVDEISLTPIVGLVGEAHPNAGSAVRALRGTLIPIGGRWYYDAKPGEQNVPQQFDYQNVDRLFYHDAQWSTPFVGNVSAWLRAGDMDFDGNVVETDQWIPDNVIIRFDSTAMIMRTRGVPNHPTGKFPEEIYRGNPSYIQERWRTYFIPLNPKENPDHIVTTLDNSNHALPMGPIGVAVNGVVFFNPFDANSQDASSLMDRCCGHPAPDNQYHYHKYPICINSPWADSGDAPSPLIGWAFDGFPIYGPYSSPNVMAKDVRGPGALNAFNGAYDADRGWHYHVTPGQFPYIIGGYWGTEDSRDRMRGRPGGMGGGNGPGGGGPPGGGRGGPNGPGGFGPGGPPDDFPPPP